MTARSSKCDFTVVWQVFDVVAETFGVDDDLLRQAAESVVRHGGASVQRLGRSPSCSLNLANSIGVLLASDAVYRSLRGQVDGSAIGIQQPIKGRAKEQCPRVGYCVIRLLLEVATSLERIPVGGLDWAMLLRRATAQACGMAA